jgi:hypothetical protein
MRRVNFAFYQCSLAGQLPPSVFLVVGRRRHSWEQIVEGDRFGFMVSVFDLIREACATCTALLLTMEG